MFEEFSRLQLCSYVTLYAFFICIIFALNISDFDNITKIITLNAKNFLNFIKLIFKNGINLFKICLIFILEKKV